MIVPRHARILYKHLTSLDMGTYLKQANRGQGSSISRQQ